ncbi:hypothetical protein AB0K52_19860 [Glycomyces sp. NPDC049804]|uniref:hypothetical protein n=1 Tax=Glycomyces sp. NPDC049804 TaxID=3154363 RepID=UPI003420C31C
MVLALLAGCATEPKLHDDFATYEVTADPIPLTPIPGADIGVWVGAIDGLDHDGWASSGLRTTDVYIPAEAEPIEDPRIEDDRFSWQTKDALPDGS